MGFLEEESKNSISNRRLAVLYDKKWRKFLKRARLFRFIPFVITVFGAGSMALGSVRQHSDFDVLIIAKKGRIFTARFFSVLFFDFFGWRRKSIIHKEEASDKICLNHFITSSVENPGWPYNDYGEELYHSLVPLFGARKDINNFFSSLKKISSRVFFTEDLRYRGDGKSFFKSALEKLFSGFLGNMLEKILKFFQLKRIKKSLSKISLPKEARIRFSDDVLEFHPLIKPCSDKLDKVLTSSEISL